MKTPNVFDFAQSERAQDAVLAYMLSWASAEHAKKNSVLHRLGKRFLRALLKSTGKEPPEKIRKVVVKTQDARVDVSVEVNGETLLLLEDKTETVRREGQIDEYVAAAKERGKSENAGWKDDVRPIYVKTGNESKRTRHATEEKCREHGGGFFYRHHLLKVLKKHTGTGNQIIEQFRAHLKSWEKDAKSYKTTPINEGWHWRAVQAYYLALEEEDLDCEGWGMVNRAGAQAFWTNGSENKDKTCALYLQIDGSKDLHIRCAARPADGETRVTAEYREEMFANVKKCLSQPEFSGIKINWKGRSGGRTATIAQATFDGKDTYMVLKEDGTVDLDATVVNLKKAEELIRASCNG